MATGSREAFVLPSKEGRRPRPINRNASRHTETVNVDNDETEGGDSGDTFTSGETVTGAQDESMADTS